MCRHIDSIVLTLRAALERAPSAALHCVLGERYLTLACPQEALPKFEAALRIDPADRRALEGAARAAQAAGDSARTEAYQLAATANSSESTVLAIAHDDRKAWAQGDAGAHDHNPGPHLRLVQTGGPHEENDDEPPPLCLADMGGLDDVKQRLERSFIAPVRHPDLYARFGQRSGAGLVLYGPPGCGKTFLARALAGEIGARFSNVSLTDVLDMWLGESERKLHEIFENARRRAPCLLFFDELDALGQRRSQLRGSAGRNLVNQLLADLDGYGERNEGLFVLGATNHPWDLDPALRRPGRFDRLVFVPPPDREARRRILELKLKSRPCAAALDLVTLAQRTEGCSGADLEGLVRAATELAIEATVGRGMETPIDQRMLLRALADLRPSPLAWLEQARNHAIYANEGGSYDDLLAHLQAVGLA